MNTKAKNQFLVIALVVVIFATLAVFNQAKANEILTLDWFTVETYTLESGEVRANFNFYYFEDNDPNSYLGSLSVAYDCDGNFTIDEIVDITEYNGLTEDDLILGMQAFGQNVDYSWNLDPEYRELAWGEGMPQMWEYLSDNGTILDDIRAEMTSQEYCQVDNAETYTTFLPLIVK